MSATNGNSPKRVRVDPAAMVPPPLSSPSSAAETSAATAASSLPTPLSDYALEMAKTVLKAFRTLHEHKKTKNNVESGTAVPRSARAKFSLTTQRRFEKDEAFQALQAAADEEVARYQAALKGIIVQKLQFEVDKMKEEAVTAAVDAAYRLTEMVYIAKGADDNNRKNCLVKHLVKTLFTDDGVKSIIDFDAGAIATDTSDATTDIILSQDEATLEVETIATVHGIIIAPIKVFHDKDTENQLLSRIKLIAFANKNNGLTAATAMAVDQEATAPPESIRDEVHKQVTQATKSIHSKLDSLVNALKNDKEGPSGASSNKKKSDRSGKQKQGQAGANNSASADALQKNKNNKRKKKKKLTDTEKSS